MSQSTNNTSDAIAAVLGRTPSGIFILTAADGNGGETGMLASWVQQAAFEPPSVTIAVNKGRYLNEWLDKSGQAALSLVAESQKGLLGHFGRGFEPGVPAFEGIAVSRGSTGLPVLADALGWMDGRIRRQMDAGDHYIYLLEVLGAGLGETVDESRPMVHIRKNGMSY